MDIHWPQLNALVRSGCPSTYWGRRGIILLVVIGLLTPTAVSILTYESTALQPGAIKQPANGTTVISVQGFKFAGKQSGKKPARVVGVGPRGSVKWVYNRSQTGIVWFYDVDPVGNGSLMFVGAKPGQTVVTVWNPRTKDTRWSRTFDWKDTHDVDLINGDQLLVANMRNYNETTEKNDARLLIYDLSEERVVWEWKFRNHGYDRDGGGKYSEDWTHVNDIDKIGPGRYMASVRNFDQVIVVDRSTGNITMQLGRDGAHSINYEQHNPDYLRGENGTPTILVADSENDRIVEYAKTDNGWMRMWTLTGGFGWPRDADRLPNGNTLVTDSLNHRVMEVTPSGEVVWEFYAPWGTYDAERIRVGDEPGGPTTREQNATGAAKLTGSAALSPGEDARLSFAEWLTNAFAETPIDSQVAWFANRWAHVTPWIRPVWMSSWGFVRTFVAGLLLVCWLITDGILYRRVIWARLRATFSNLGP